MQSHSFGLTVTPVGGTPTAAPIVRAPALPSPLSQLARGSRMGVSSPRVHTRSTPVHLAAGGAATPSTTITQQAIPHTPTPEDTQAAILQRGSPLAAVMQQLMQAQQRAQGQPQQAQQAQQAQGEPQPFAPPGALNALACGGMPKRFAEGDWVQSSPYLDAGEKRAHENAGSTPLWQSLLDPSQFVGAGVAGAGTRALSKLPALGRMGRLSKGWGGAGAQAAESGADDYDFARRNLERMLKMRQFNRMMDTAG